MANLLVDIGNTVLKAAWADGITLGKTFRYQGEHMVSFILSLTDRVRPEVLVISSARDMVPLDEDRLKTCCDRLVIMDSMHRDMYRDVPEYLTADRYASIVAARYLFRNRECVIFDFGTTLTIDFLDKEGKYAGGNISLGCRTRFKALNRYSKALPLVDTPESVCEKGMSLRTSIESGVISGIMFEIQGYLGQNHENIVIFTGGDAIYFAKRFKNSIFVVCNLVLMGLAILAEEYVG